MDLPAALIADLAALSRAIDQPGVVLEAGLRALVADLQRAVPFYLGLRMTMKIDGHQISFTTYSGNEPVTQIATSLMLPLTADSGPHGGSTLVLYAATLGAFVDLADLSCASSSTCPP